MKQTLHLFIALDCNMLLESESFYIPVPSSDAEQTEYGEISLVIKSVMYIFYMCKFSVLMLFYVMKISHIRVIQCTGRRAHTCT